MTSLVSSAPLASPYGKSIAKYHFVGVALIAAFGVGFGVWGATAPLSAAVIAGGRIEVDGSVKRVQHETGGTVAQILVQEGSHVTEGQVIARLDPTTAQAALDIIANKLDELWMTAARLKAERDGLSVIELPAFFARRQDEPSVAALFNTEQRLFAVRLAARNGQKDQLAARIDQYDSQIVGLKTQQTAKARQLELTSSDLVAGRELLDRGVATKAQVNVLERDLARLEGEQGEIEAQIAEVAGRIAETRLQILGIDQGAIAEAGRDLGDTTSSIAELSQRRLTAAEQLKRMEIKAPVEGIVYQLAIHTVGGVIGSGEVIASVVPTVGALNVEARLSPTDIDMVAPGQSALIRFPGLAQATTPELQATVKVVGADLTEDPATRLSYYAVTLAIDSGEIAKLDGVTLVPGMPVETFISEAPRTFLDYLLRPFSDRMARALREN